MRHEDFHIGIEFLTPEGRKWRCTDKGQRTITAIEIDTGLADAWYEGPPYCVEEHLFNEHEMGPAYLTFEHAVAQALEEHKTSGHPGYPMDTAREMFKRYCRHDRTYPRSGILRHDRVSEDGKILHPVRAVKDGDLWLIDALLVFEESFALFPENDFILLPLAAPDSIRKHAAAFAAQKSAPISFS